MGTFTIEQVRRVLDEGLKIGTVDNVYFEGGEPFLYYPLLIQSLKEAKNRNLKTGLVTNAYWANSPEDAELWLKPLCEVGIDDLSISDDAFHQSEEGVNTAKIAKEAALKMGLPAASICIEKPAVEYPNKTRVDKGQPVIGGNARFKGRAADKLIDGLPRRPVSEFTSCPDEELEKPGRVHVDPFGEVHICQGLSIGNMWDTPLSDIIMNYNAGEHPVAGPLAKGGPLALARKYNLKHEPDYVDACHFCFEIRRQLIDRFPQYLAPRQVYGLDE